MLIYITDLYFDFSLGETYYNLKDAQDLRLKLMKLAESVDLIRYIKLFFF